MNRGILVPCTVESAVPQPMGSDSSRRRGSGSMSVAYGNAARRRRAELQGFWATSPCCRNLNSHTRRRALQTDRRDRVSRPEFACRCASSEDGCIFGVDGLEEVMRGASALARLPSSSVACSLSSSRPHSSMDIILSSMGLLQRTHACEPSSRTPRKRAGVRPSHRRHHRRPPRTLRSSRSLSCPHTPSRARTCRYR